MPDMLYERFPATHYAVFTMHRPDRLNAQGSNLRQGLDVAIYEFAHDSDIRVGIVTCTGRAFSSRPGLREMAERNAVDSEAGALSGESQTTLDERFERPRLSQPFGSHLLP